MKPQNEPAAKTIGKVSIPMIDPQSPAPLAFEKTYKYVINDK